MKQTIKLIIRYLFYGVSLGCTSFVFMCLSFFVGGGTDILDQIFKDFARQSVGAMIVGIACGGTTIVYQIRRLPGLVKTGLHFCVGMGVFYPTAIILGWIPFYPDNIAYTAIQIFFSCCIFMAIWFCFYLFNRNDAKKINQRLRELERER